MYLACKECDIVRTREDIDLNLVLKASCVGGILVNGSHFRGICEMKDNNKNKSSFI